jgi:hypothetical protein
MQKETHDRVFHIGALYEHIDQDIDYSLLRMIRARVKLRRFDKAYLDILSTPEENREPHGPIIPLVLYGLDDVD